ncbi:MAG: hypothetical protein GQE15_29705 [Archangiaceae bacterium]|mgnify:CR=1 FL=1|nr:hypothetical protein [Archangiaceae bacterium]
MKVRTSTWVLLVMLAANTVVAARPRFFMPAAWFRPLPHQEYGFTTADFALIVLLVALTVLAVVILLYAVIRAALRPDFRRDALILGMAIVLNGAGWFLASWLNQR